MGFPAIEFYVPPLLLPIWWKPLAESGFSVKLFDTANHQFIEPEEKRGHELEFESRVAGYGADHIVGAPDQQRSDLPTITVFGSSGGWYRLSSALVATGMRLLSTQYNLGFDAIWALPGHGDGLERAGLIDELVSLLCAAHGASQVPGDATGDQTDHPFASRLIRRGSDRIELWSGVTVGTDAVGRGVFIAIRKRGLRQRLLKDSLPTIQNWIAVNHGHRIETTLASAVC